MRICIAGHGNIGHFVQEMLAPYCQIAFYDPPKGWDDVRALIDVDMVFICVPTPPLPDGACDTSIVEEVVALARPTQAIVCHSTVAIGTTERLRRQYGKPLVFVPEYAGESPDHPYRQKGNRSFFIVGGCGPEAEDVRDLLRRVYGDAPVVSIVPPTVAEVVKYMENAFLALKVGFCNAFYDLCRAVDVDFQEARALWLQDRRVNPDHTMVTPERGYGGMCLPKDVAAVLATARDLGVPFDLLEGLQAANDRHRQMAVHLDGSALSKRT